MSTGDIEAHLRELYGVRAGAAAADRWMIAVGAAAQCPLTKASKPAARDPLVRTSLAAS
jgi:hypothetical protein